MHVVVGAYAFGCAPVRAFATGSHAWIFGVTVEYVLNAPLVPVKFSLKGYMVSYFSSHPQLRH